jgi:hypothetical protein
MSGRESLAVVEIGMSGPSGTLRIRQGDEATKIPEQALFARNFKKMDLLYA